MGQTKDRRKRRPKYFRIGEVAEMLGVNAHTVRYWQERFGRWVKPKTSTGGWRKYSQNDIKQLRRIFHLCREKRMTIDGAKALMDLESQGLDFYENKVIR